MLRCLVWAQRKVLVPLTHTGSLEDKPIQINDKHRLRRMDFEYLKLRPGADCGSDHELLSAKFRLKLKKVGKTPRPFSYDLNQIPYDYTGK